MNIYCIIVSFNGSKWIIPCIQSLKSSTIKVHIIVIDNGSSDNSTDLIRTNFPEVVLIENKINLGFGKANNIGFGMALNADADYVFLLNQDACVEENTIEKLIEASKRNLEFGIISPIHLNGKGDGLDLKFSNNVSVNRKLYFDALKNNYKSEIYEVPFVNAAAWLLTKKVISEIGGFDQIFYHYGEDANLCQRARFHGFKIGIVPNCFIKHERGNRVNIKNELFSIEYFDNYLIELKCKYADITQCISTDSIRYEKKKIIKLIIKSLMKLNIFASLKYIKQYRLITKTFKLIFKSRDTTSKKGVHYLN